MKKIFITFSIFVLVLLNSCKTYDYFSIKVLEPADLAFPANYKKIVIAHNLYRTSADTSGTIYSLFGTIKTDTAYLYDLIASEAIFSLQDFLNVSDRFVAGIFDSIHYRYPKSTDDFTMNDLDLIRQICHENDADALVLLNDFSTFDSYDMMIDRWGAYFGEFKVVVKTSWLLFDPFKAKIADSKITLDTLYFQTEPWYFDESINEFDFRKDVLIKSASHAGMGYGKRISPFWTETGRLIFKNGSKELRKGFKESQLGNWQNAANYWQKALNNPQILNQAKAAFNLGLAYEMDGSLEPAIEWVQKSVEIFPDTINNIYLHILQKRLNEQDDIFYQMEGTNTDKH